MNDQLANFIAITNCQDPKKAEQFLDMSGGNLEVNLIRTQSHYSSTLVKMDWAAALTQLTTVIYRFKCNQ